MRQLGMGIALVAGLIGLAEPSAAKVLKFEVLRIEFPAFEGRGFGSVGTYDRIIARATVGGVAAAIRVTPSSSTSSAPRETRRAWSRRQPMSKSSVRLSRPTATGASLYDVVNRGGAAGARLFQRRPAPATIPVKAADAGSGFLMSRGYTVVMERLAGRCRRAAAVGKQMSVPIVPHVTGLSREEFIFDHTRRIRRWQRSAIRPPISDPTHASLTVRQREADPRVSPADLELQVRGAAARSRSSGRRSSMPARSMS